MFFLQYIKNSGLCLESEQRKVTDKIKSVAKFDVMGKLLNELCVGSIFFLLRPVLFLSAESKMKIILKPWKES